MFNKQIKILSFLISCFLFLSLLNPLSIISVRAEGESTETTYVKMQLKSGSNNGNSHFSQNATPEAFVLTNTLYGNPSFSFRFKLLSEKDDTRFRFVTSYKDDNNWAYIAYDGFGSNNWFLEYKKDGQGSWPSLSTFKKANTGDLFSIDQGDEVEYFGLYSDAGLDLTVFNVTKNQTVAFLITDENFLAVTRMQGKMGFGAATYNSSFTDIALSKVRFDQTTFPTVDTYTSNFSFYKQVDGQIFSEYTDPTDSNNGTSDTGSISTDDDDTDDEASDADVETWIKVSSTNKSSGHNYESASAPAVSIYDATKTTTSANLSMRIKPSVNWAIFYSYKDTNNWLYVGYDDYSKWYYQYNLGGSSSYQTFTGLPEVTAGDELNFMMSIDREVLTLNVNGTEKRVTNQAFLNFMNQHTGAGRVAVKTNHGEVSFTNVRLNNQELPATGWRMLRPRSGQTHSVERIEKVAVTGLVKDAEQRPIAEAQVRLGTLITQTNASGEFTFPKVSQGEYGLAVTKAGYRPYSERVEVSSTNANHTIVLQSREDFDISRYDLLSNDQLKVYIGKNFPFVARYTSATNSNEFMAGNEENLTTFGVNDLEVTPTVTIKEQTSTSRTYTLAVQEQGLHFDMDVRLTLKANQLEWKVVDLRKHNNVPIAKLDFKKLNLLSIDINSTNAKFDAAGKSTDVTDRKDYHVDATNFTPSTQKGYLYAFVTNEFFSAGLYSNSEVEGDLRVWAKNSADKVMLDSNVFYYERGDVAGARRTTLVYPKSDLPLIRVALAKDLNADNQLDWNDGAIAYRDIQNVPLGSEKIKEMVNYRIAMNFAGHATNPYLKTADNIKRVHLATDGLPQAVMLKGYGNLGHDSANSEYADIAKWQGGVKDFRKLIEIAHEYNTEIGIHINAQEAYPESKSFNENLITNPVNRGWGWLDQSFVIDKQRDLANQARYKRLVQLYDRINGTSHYNRAWPNAVEDSLGEVTTPREQITAEAKQKPNNMDFIYLDVWYQDAWETRQIAKEINSLGWRFSTEFSGQGEHDSTWQHWSTEAKYGGKGAKGLNSQIIRFIKNSLRDSQVMNHPPYAGAADNPLLGGYTLNGFEGWGSNNSFKEYIHETFLNNLPTRFLQHYDVVKWVNYGAGEQSPTANIEKEITLKNAQGDTVVVTRKTEQRRDHIIERIITLNGKKVLEDGAYLLPWTDKDGTKKLYHYNEDGGSTTWEVGADFTNVTIYELTSNGRINPVEQTANNGTLTFVAKPRVPYVVVPTAQRESKPTIKPYGEHSYLKDPGFNQYLPNGRLVATHFTGDINNPAVKVIENVRGDKQLSIERPTSDINLTTQISNLVPNQAYVAYVYVNNQSEVGASLTVNNGEKESKATAFLSTLANYVRADGEKAGLLMNRMQVSFIAKSTTAELKLSTVANDGVVNFDDMYVLPVDAITEIQEDGSFTQDFENVAFGYHPFVLGSAEGINDPVTHLSEKHAPYTQKGWQGRKVDDVIDGQWSLKHHGSNTGIIYQTLPQTFYFEPGKVYDVEFDYQVTANKGYAFVVGEGPSYRVPSEDAFFAPTSNTTRHRFTFTAAPSGLSWIGLYERSSHVGRDWKDSNFILDNLVIRENKTIKTAELSEDTIYLGSTIKVVGNDPAATVHELGDAGLLRIEGQRLVGVRPGTTTVEIRLSNNEVNGPLTVTVLDKKKFVKEFEEIRDQITVTTNNQQDEGEGAAGGHATHAFDNSPSTHWHTRWSGNSVTPSNPAVLEFTFPEAEKMAGFAILQRQGSSNGLIQRFKYEVINAEGHTIEVRTVDVPAELRQNGQIIPVDFTESRQAKKVKISVLQGYGNFASISEVSFFDTLRLATNAEIGFPDRVETFVSDTLQISPNEAPEGTFLPEFKFKAKENETLLTITEDGRIKALAGGETTVRVTTELGYSKEIRVIIGDRFLRLASEIANTTLNDLAEVVIDRELAEQLEIIKLEVSTLATTDEEATKLENLLVADLKKDVNSFDIVLKDGEDEIIPKDSYLAEDFSARVRLPLLRNRKLKKVYYVDLENNVKEEIADFVVLAEDNKVEFIVPHFSVYSLVYEPVKENTQPKEGRPTSEIVDFDTLLKEYLLAPTSKEKQNSKEKDMQPKTSTTANSTSILLLAIIVSLLALVSFYKRKV